MADESELLKRVRALETRTLKRDRVYGACIAILFLLYMLERVL